MTSQLIYTIHPNSRALALAACQTWTSKTLSPVSVRRLRTSSDRLFGFDLKFSVGHCQAVFCKASSNNECLGDFRRFGALRDFLVAPMGLGFVGPVPQQESFRPSAPHSTNMNVYRRKVLRMVETRLAPAVWS